MIQFMLLNNHDGPEDFVVHFQDRQWECDSYFFWMDPALPPDLSLDHALHLLITQWRTIRNHGWDPVPAL